MTMDDFSDLKADLDANEVFFHSGKEDLQDRFRTLLGASVGNEERHRRSIGLYEELILRLLSDSSIGEYNLQFIIERFMRRMGIDTIKLKREKWARLGEVIRQAILQATPNPPEEIQVAMFGLIDEFQNLILEGALDPSVEGIQRKRAFQEMNRSILIKYFPLVPFPKYIRMFCKWESYHEPN